MTIKDLIIYGRTKLDRKYIDESVLKTRLLLESCLGKTREYMMVHLDEEVTRDVEEKFMSYISRAAQNEPVQYIIGKQEFMGLTFSVNKSVLIPRSDTEILVEEVINIVKTEINNTSDAEIVDKNINILDMCTGSGAIIISLAHYLKDYNINYYASDVSGDAIEVATQNGENNDVKINFMISDLFKSIPEIKFDIIVSNPPYVERNVIENLDENVKREPYIALDGGIDGLDFYKEIIKESNKFLNKNAYLCFEIGYNQRESVTNLLKENDYVDIHCIKDLGQNDRVIVSRKG